MAAPNFRFHADDLIKKYKKKTAKPDELAITPEKKASWNNHLGSLTHIRLLHNEQILSTSSDGKFTLWRGPEGGIAREWMGESKKMLILDNDQYLVCVSHGNFGTEPGYAKIYDMNKAEWTCMYKGHELFLTDIAQYGGWIATASADSTVRLWDFAPQENEMHMASDWLEMQVKTPKFTLRHKDQVNVVLYIGNILYSASADKTIISWNPNATQNKVFTGHTGSVTAICGIQQHNLLFSASADSTLRSWNTQTGQCVSVLKTKYPFVGLMIHKEVLYAWTDGPKFYIAAIDLKSASYTKFKGPSKKITGVRFSNECLFVSSADGHFWQWDLEAARCVTKITAPPNRDGIGTFLVHKTSVFCGTERIIHLFPLMDDTEIRSGRSQRAAALAQAMSKRSLSKASGADVKSSPSTKDLKKEDKKGSGKNVATPASTPPAASPSTPTLKTSAGANTPSTASPLSRQATTAAFDPLEERYGTQSSFDKVNPAVNDLVLKTKLEREKKEAAERAEAAKKAVLSSSGNGSPSSARTASVSGPSTPSSFSPATGSSGSLSKATAAIVARNANSTASEDWDDSSDRSERSNPNKKKSVAEKLLFERKGSTSAATTTTSSSSGSGTPTASPSVSRANASASPAAGSKSSSSVNPINTFSSAASSGSPKRASGNALSLSNSASTSTILGPPPAMPPPPAPQGTGPAVLTGSGPVITYTAISKVYQTAPPLPLLSGQKEKTPPNTSPLSSTKGPLHSGGAKTNPEVFAAIPPPSPTSAAAAANAAAIAAASAPASKGAATVKIVPTTPIETFMNMLLPEMKNFEESKMEQIITHLKDEAIMEVQDLMLLQDEHYRELKVPLGLALRIKGKLKELPPM